MNALIGTDAILLAFWESTVNLRYSQIANAADSSSMALLRLMNQYVTAGAFRNIFRTIVATLWIVAASLLLIFQTQTFGWQGKDFPRQICGSSGWESDEDNVNNTYISLILSFFAIVAHPVFVASHSCSMSGVQEAVVGKTGRIPAREATGTTKPDADYTNIMIFGASLGTVALIVDSVVMQVSFGVEWARSVAIPGSTRFNTVKLQTVLYELAQSSTYVVISSGAIISFIIGRWLFGGRGPVFVAIYLLWATASIALLIPLVGNDSTQYAFDNFLKFLDDSSQDMTDGIDYCLGLETDWRYTYCNDVRHWVLLGAALFLVGAIGGLVLYWGFRLTISRSCFPKLGAKYQRYDVPLKVARQLSRYGRPDDRLIGSNLNGENEMQHLWSDPLCSSDMATLPSLSELAATELKTSDNCSGALKR